jgi:hypothetical protein
MVLYGITDGRLFGSALEMCKFIISVQFFKVDMQKWKTENFATSNSTMKIKVTQFNIYDECASY